MLDTVMENLTRWRRGDQNKTEKNVNCWGVTIKKNLNLGQLMGKRQVHLSSIKPIDTNSLWCSKNRKQNVRVSLRRDLNNNSTSWRSPSKNNNTWKWLFWKYDLSLTRCISKIRDWKGVSRGNLDIFNFLSIFCLGTRLG